jgi:hypothetical protein
MTYPILNYALLKSKNIQLRYNFTVDDNSKITRELAIEYMNTTEIVDLATLLLNDRDFGAWWKAIRYDKDNKINAFFNLWEPPKKRLVDKIVEECGK